MRFRGKVASKHGKCALLMGRASSSQDPLSRSYDPSLILVVELTKEELKCQINKKSDHMGTFASLKMDLYPSCPALGQAV